MAQVSYLLYIHSLLNPLGTLTNVKKKHWPTQKPAQEFWKTRVPWILYENRMRSGGLLAFSLVPVWYPRSPLEPRDLGPSLDHLSHALFAHWILDTRSGQADGWETLSRENGVPEPPATALRHGEAWGRETTGENQHLSALNWWFTTHLQS